MLVVSVLVNKISECQIFQLTLSNPIFVPTAYLPRNRKSTTCAICWLKCVLHDEKCRTGSDSRVSAQTQQKNVLDVTQHRSGRGKS